MLLQHIAEMDATQEFRMCFFVFAKLNSMLICFESSYLSLEYLTLLVSCELLPSPSQAPPSPPLPGQLIGPVSLCFERAIREKQAASGIQFLKTV